MRVLLILGALYAVSLIDRTNIRYVAMIFGDPRILTSFIVLREWQGWLLTYNC